MSFNYLEYLKFIGLTPIPVWLATTYTSKLKVGNWATSLKSCISNLKGSYPVQANLWEKYWVACYAPDIK